MHKHEYANTPTEFPANQNGISIPAGLPTELVYGSFMYTQWFIRRYVRSLAPTSEVGIESREQRFT